MFYNWSRLCIRFLPCIKLITNIIIYVSIRENIFLIIIYFTSGENSTRKIFS